MNISDYIVFATLFVVIIIISFQLNKFFKRYKSATQTNSPLLNHHNYNIDFRIVIKEKLTDRRWMFWFTLSVVVSLLPMLVSQDLTWVSLGLLVSWCLMVASYAGIINQPDTQDIIRFAKDNILYFAPVGKYNEREGPLLGSVLDLSKTRAQKITNVLTSLPNNNKPIEFCMFKLAFEYPTTGALHLYQYHMVFIDTNELNIPSFYIDGGQVYDFEQFVQLKDKERIRLEGSFGDKYQVFIKATNSSENRLLALSMLSPDVMKLYETYFQSSSMVQINGRIVIMTRNDIYEDGSFKEFYQGALEYTHKLKRQIDLRQNVNWP